MPRPQWIVFDAVGTLITPMPSVAEAYAAVGQRYGVALPVDVIRTRFRDAFRTSETACFAMNRRGRTSEAEELARWRWIVQAVLPEANNPEACFSDLWQHFADPQCWRCYDDVAPVLRELNRLGVGIAMASNFDQRLQHVCDGLPDPKGIDRVFVSSAIGARKPDPLFYHLVAEQLNVHTDALLMVGDDLECDVIGPRQSGWQARLLHREAPSTAESWSSLHELLPWLGAFSGRGSG